MRYVLREKFWSLGGKYEITNEGQELVYRVEGKAFSYGDVLTFRDADGVEVLSIQQRLMTSSPTYDIVKDGAVIAEVRQEGFSYTNVGFSLSSIPGAPDELVVHATGDLTNHEYRFTEDEQTLATVSKEWYSVTDTYGIDIDASVNNDVILLALTVVIDLVCHDATGDI